MPPEVAGILTRAEAGATLAAIASAQQADGCVPAAGDGTADPWNHLEAAMALDAGGARAEAERAYAWLLDSQREDGSWAISYRAGEVLDAGADANFCAYVATGAWHHFLASDDAGFLADLWIAVERAIEFALALQAPGGEVLWARDAGGRAWPGALLASSSCIHLSLACALSAARRLGRERPRWESARARLGQA
ncbi:MAG: prenyltransferase, partial [Candidatus Dormibacteraceae bacterium]